MVSKKDIKLISSLKHKKFRDLNSAFVVEGRKSISEFLISQFKLVKLFSIDCSAFDFVTNQIEVDYNELKKISFFNNPDDHLAIFEIPNKKYYDPRKWIREGELTFKARLKQSFEDLNNINTNK